MVPRISIVIATYNCAEDLQECLNSIASQDWHDKEIIISDGGSSDGTVGIIKANQNMISFWKSEEDCGIYDAWNQVLDRTTGDWIYFIGADDILHAPDCLRRVAEKLRGVPEKTLIGYAQALLVRSDGSKRLMGHPWEDVRSAMHSKMALPHQAVFHSRALFEMYGKFDATFQIAGDYKLIMESLKHAEPQFLGEIVVAEQRTGGKSGLRKNRTDVLCEFRAVQKELGLPLRLGWVFDYIKGLGWRVFSRIRDVGAGS